ncbi:TPA: hypothetical protein ACSXWB_006729, partial [Pseudomonas aeruginosa]
MRRLLLVALLLLSGNVSAEDFYWRIAYPDGQAKHKSAEAACQANNDYYKSDYGSGYSRIEVRNKPIDETHWNCYVYAYKLDSKGVEYLARQRGNNATRYGTKCPAGTEYDSSIGGCKQNEDEKCKETFGKEIYTDFQVGTVKDGHFTDPKSPPASLCESSCLYTSPATTGSGNGYRMGQ